MRLGGLLINSRIETLRGGNFLYELWALGYGQDKETGYGQLRHVAAEEIFFNKQTRENYAKREIETQVRLGTQAQSAIAWFPEYCQSVSPDNYAQFGIDRRAIVTASNVIYSVTYPNAKNILFSPDQRGFDYIQKNTGGDGWNAYAATDGSVNVPGTKAVFLSFRAGQLSVTRAAGLSGTPNAASWVDLEHGFLLDGPGYEIVESGKRLTGKIPYAAADVFRVETNNAGDRLRYLINGVEVFVSSQLPALTMYGHFLFFAINSRLEQAATSRYELGIKGASEGQGSFTAIANEFAALNATDDYTVQNAGPPKGDLRPFKIISKMNTTLTATINQAKALPVSEPVYAYWAARYETTKRVTAVELNLEFNIHARTLGRVKSDNVWGIVSAQFLSCLRSPWSLAEPKRYLSENRAVLCAIAQPSRTV